jgi:uncharacterized coiled-coil protein SlyX
MVVPQKSFLAKANQRDMDVESTEIQLARLDERMKMLLDRMEDNHNSHTQTREWMQKTDETLTTIGNRLVNVEGSLQKAAPTIDEFLTIKHKIIGAGVAGKWMWATFGALLGIVISLRQQVISWFTGAS